MFTKKQALLLAISVLLFNNNSFAYTGFDKLANIDFGKVEIGKKASDYRTVCNTTDDSPTVTATWENENLGVVIADPFTLDTTSYKLSNSNKVMGIKGECHNFIVYYTPTDTNQICKNLVFVYDVNALSPTKTKKTISICGGVNVINWLPAVINLINN